jgi:choline kinase
MQAIILAAGVSKRLRPLTDTTPKCLLGISGKNLLHRTIDNLTVNGITDFICVTGYRENMIKEYVNENFPGLNFTFITNPGYDNNNNSYSLWMTKDFVKEDIILLDSDILFEHGIIKKLIMSGFENCLAVNVTDKLDEEQIKVTIDEKKRILEISKEVEIKKAAGESIGIEKFSKNFMNELFVILDRKITKENNVNEFYEKSFEELLNIKDKNIEIYSVDISEFNCTEIDTVEDYKKAQNLLI